MPQLDLNAANQAWVDLNIEHNFLFSCTLKCFFKIGLYLAVKLGSFADNGGPGYTFRDGATGSDKYIVTDDDVSATAPLNMLIPLLIEIKGFRFRGRRFAQAGLPRRSCRN